MPPADSPPATGNRDRIVATARNFAVAYRASIYSQTNRSTSAMDCSYFVYLVFHEVFPDYEYMDTATLLTSSKFKVTAAPQPGDLVFFPSGVVPYEVQKGNKRVFPNHVGIVADQQSWIGRQTSALGAVLFTNPWWASRTCKYLTYTK